MLRRTVTVLHGPLLHGVGNKKLPIGTGILPMLPSNHIYHDPPKLRVALDRDGYLYFKNVVPKELMDKAFMDIGDQMIANRWVRPEDRATEEEQNGFTLGCPFPRNCLDGKTELPTPTAGFGITKNITDAIAGISVSTVLRQVLSGPVKALPQHTLELSKPGEVHPFHMDHPFHSKGTPLLLTAWIPLQPVTLSLGGLAVVKSSNSSEQFKKIRLTYGNSDVEDGDIYGDGSYTADPEEIITRSKMTPEELSKETPPTAGTDTGNGATATESKTGQPADVPETAKILQTHLDDEDVDEMDVSLGGSSPIVSTSFEVGDIVIFTTYTMHAFLTNQTDHWRISAESKWMMEGDDIGPDPRFATANSPGLSSWMEHREDRQRYRRSMEEAKHSWGIFPFAQ